MKFHGLRKFYGNAVSDIQGYLRVDVSKAFEDLVLGLRKLTFSENFAAYTFDVTIKAGATATIPNRHGSLAVLWFPVRLVGDARLVEDGAVTKDYIYIKNASSTDTTVKLLILKE